MLSFIDTHCHLDAPEFTADRDAVVARAQAAGVQTLVVPAITAGTLDLTLAMRRAYGCPLALGLHPIYVDQHDTAALTTLRARVEQEMPVAIGEIGLDFFVDGLDRERQLEVFRAQLKLALEFDLPVLLHVRRAQDEVLRELRRYRPRAGIAHAFNGSRQQADAFIKLGFKLGFGGAMTFERALNLRRHAVELPLESIVLETDAPDISPEWAYKQRNEPAYLPRIATVLAELRQIDIATVAAQTSENARQVLGPVAITKPMAASLPQ
ncbi:TatD family hydrolase [Parachitinimonas caeni]|uniref:TatD family hydrolase n=1 Tax=Parachitinimonas caeni TaxID=3031301 RepID=A0ABT7E2R1_9NEIS|nr:TatD family hydrolase [Parachitinimonas caeni]MDK2125202.1 TatD family hydrolase [Parachitinimonas caeni]